MKLTPWYPSSMKPVRAGVYQIRMQVVEDRLGGTAIEEGFCYFGGVGWAITQSTPEEARANCAVLGSQHKAWRGLAEEPR